MQKVVRTIIGLVRYGVIAWLARPKDAVRFWRSIAATAASYVPAMSGTVPQVALDDALPGSEDQAVDLLAYRSAYGDPTFYELLTICRIARRTDPRRIFEIGTFEGGTTLQLAANTTATLWTLDLPPDVPRPIVDPELDVYPESPGWRVHTSAFADRVHQLLGDSSTFDFSPWKGEIDLVFVDGSHHYEHVRQDTDNAVRMARPGGLVIWHDYAVYAPGVVRAIEEALPLFESVVHIAETSLVVGRTPA